MSINLNIHDIGTRAFPGPDSRFEILWCQSFKLTCQILEILIYWKMRHLALRIFNTIWAAIIVCTESLLWH